MCYINLSTISLYVILTSQLKSPQWYQSPLLCETNVARCSRSLS